MSSKLELSEVTGTYRYAVTKHCTIPVFGREIYAVQWCKHLKILINLLMGCPKIFSSTAIFSSFTTDLWVTARNYSYNKKTVTRLDLYKYSICVWLILTGID